MKKKIIILAVVIFCVLLIGFILVKFYIQNNESNLEKEYIEIEILSVSTKGIRIEITNNDKNEFLFGDDFILKKQGKHGWQKVKFKDGVLWPKTVNELKSGESLEKKIIWVDYFDKELPKGKYRMEWNAAGIVEFELENEDVTTKILSVSSKEIKIEITNNGNNNVMFCDSFELEELENYYINDHGWQMVVPDEEIRWPQTVNELKSGESIQKNIVWMDYWGRELPKGKYRMKWDVVDIMEFEIQ